MPRISFDFFTLLLFSPVNICDIQHYHSGFHQCQTKIQRRDRRTGYSIYHRHHRIFSIGRRGVDINSTVWV